MLNHPIDYLIQHIHTWVSHDQVSISESTATNSRTPRVSAGYFSSVGCFVGIVMSMSAKPTQFSFHLCCSFPAVSSKSYIVTNYALNVPFICFCQPGVVSCTCGEVLTS